MSDVAVRAHAARRGLTRLEHALERAATLTLQAAVAAAKASAKGTDEFRDRSGKTRRSIQGGTVGPYLGFVEAGGAAGFLEHGTAPHLIVAHGRALRFEAAGQVLYRQWVQHPGTRPRPFMREAATVGRVAAEWAAEVYVRQAIESAR